MLPFLKYSIVAVQLFGQYTCICSPSFYYSYTLHYVLDFIIRNAITDVIGLWCCTYVNIVNDYKHLLLSLKS